MIKARFNLRNPSSNSDNFALDVDLTLPDRGVTAIFGPSGSGKTTLLRCIAGLHKVADGSLSVAEKVWQDQVSCLPTHKRNLACVFQQARLFPHLNVKQNLNYAIQRGDSSASMDTKLLQLLGIEDLLARNTGSLSGGEQQRVAIARALLSKPKLLLMDEPLASLDQARKQEILPYLEQLRTELDIPILYVSHSLDEVTRLADYMVVLDKGKVAQQGPAMQVLNGLQADTMVDDPCTVVEAEVTEDQSRWHLVSARFAGGELQLRNKALTMGENIRIRIHARDISLALSPPSDSSILNVFPASILNIEESVDDATALVTLRIGEPGRHTELLAQLTRKSIHQLQLAAGQAVWAQLKSAAIVR